MNTDLCYVEAADAVAAGLCMDDHVRILHLLHARWLWTHSQWVFHRNCLRDWQLRHRVGHIGLESLSKLSRHPHEITMYSRF